MTKLDSKKMAIFVSFLNQLARELTSYYKTKLDKPFKVINKSKDNNYDPVTSADKKFEKFIRMKIKKKFPSHGLIGEEYGFKKNSSKFTWVIDPIDGTRSFVVGNPTWSNLISLNYEGKPILGLANFPKLNKYYLNISDKGSFVIDQGKKRKINCSKNSSFKKIKVAGNFHGYISLNKQKKIPKVINLMQFPCTDALSYAHFCEGKMDAVIQCGNKIWDIHPLIPIIEASGGIITTWKNTSAIKGGNILVTSNKSFHNKLLKLLKPLSKL